MPGLSKWWICLPGFLPGKAYNTLCYVVPCSRLVVRVFVATRVCMYTCGAALAHTHVHTALLHVPNVHIIATLVRTCRCGTAFAHTVIMMLKYD